MQDASFSGNVSTSSNTNTVGQNGQINATAINSQAKSAENTSIFGSKNNKANSNINQSHSNSHGTGGLGNIFIGGSIPTPSSDNTSIFAGIKRGGNYSLYSKKDINYDIPKLTQESIFAQKGLTEPKRTNPKAFNIDMTPKENPYAAFRNPELNEPTLGDTISKFNNKIASIFNKKKAD